MRIVKCIAAAVVSLVLFSACNPAKKVEKDDSANLLNSALEKAKHQPNFENFINLGMVYSQKGEGGLAIEQFLKAKTLNPNAPLAWNNLCAEFNQLKNYIEGKIHCEKALELEPEFQLAKNNLEVAKAGLNQQVAEGEKTLKQWEKEPSDNHEEKTTLGLVFYHTKNYKNAIDVWSLIPKESDQYALAQSNIASAFTFLKSFSKAEVAIKKALAVEPDNELFQNNKTWIQEEKKKN